MTDIRCPMCGKSNPAELDVCQYCQARLKPLISGSGQEGAGGQDEDIPEWLRSLRPDSGLEPPSNEQAEPFEGQPEELPDWLAGEKAGAPKEDSSQAAGTPDWLTGFRDQGSQEEAGPLEESQTGGEDVTEEIPKAEDIPDWLKSMHAGPSQALPAEEPEEPAETPIQGEDEGAEPEWLQRLGAAGEEQPRAPIPREDDADFLASLRGAGTEAAETGEETPEAQAAPEAEKPAELPDWLSVIGPPEQAAQNEKAPDWMMGEPPTPPEEPAKEESLPSWMVEQPQAPVEEPAEESLPTWLASQPEVPAEEARTEGGVPSWLAAFNEMPESAEPTRPEEAIPTPEVPGEGSGESPVPPEAEMLPEGATPAWLDQLAPTMPEEETRSEIPSEPAGVEVPDWLEAYAAGSEAEEAFSPGASEQAPDLTLDWLESQAGAPEAEQISPETIIEQPPQPGEPEARAPFVSGEEGLPLPVDQGEIPEWLGKPPEEPTPAETGEPSVEEREGLTEAELPSWLTAMRPLEMAASAAPVIEESDRPAEESGPLAGLRSVLPGKLEAGKVKAPPAYTVKLQVSETQQAHASVIENLVKSEGEAGKIQIRKATRHQAVILIGVFALLFLVILWKVFTGSQDVGLPAYPQEIVDARSLVSGVIPEAPVLLAVDYEPGFSGELEATASEVIDQLMLNGAYLTLVSTLPSGPAQAERLVQGVNDRLGHTYQEFNQYANLGYIPGGAAGLRSFAESPRRMIPYALNTPGGQSAWKLPSLSKVNSLADFGLVVVITENPYTARTWIEQAGPVLGSSSLVMVVSAQAEPLVRPYYEGQPRQVQGIIAGLAGGAAYENMSGRGGMARTYWDAYSFGISIIAVVLVIGCVVNLALALLGNPRKPAGEARR